MTNADKLDLQTVCLTTSTSDALKSPNRDDDVVVVAKLPAVHKASFARKTATVCTRLSTSACTAVLVTMFIMIMLDVCVHYAEEFPVVEKQYKLSLIDFEGACKKDSNSVYSANLKNACDEVERFISLPLKLQVVIAAFGKTANHFNWLPYIELIFNDMQKLGFCVVLFAITYRFNPFAGLLSSWTSITTSKKTKDD